jgi:hypothetical protein
MSLKLGHIYAYDCEALRKPKIGLCISEKASWLFWFNSERRRTADGQLPVPKTENRVFTKDGYLNMSLVVRMDVEEMKGATDYGQMSDQLRVQFIEMLKQPIRTLSALQRDTILRNFSA